MTHTRSLLSTACDGGVSPNVPQLVPCSCWTPCAHSPQPHQLSPSWLQTPHRGAPLEQPPHPAHPTKGCSEGCWGGPIPSATAHHVPPLPGGFPVLLQGPDSFAQQPHGAQHLPPARLHEALPSEGGGGICRQGVRWEGDGTRSLPPCAGVPRSPPFPQADFPEEDKSSRLLERLMVLAPVPQHLLEKTSHRTVKAKVGDATSLGCCWAPFSGETRGQPPARVTRVRYSPWKPPSSVSAEISISESCSFLHSPLSWHCGDRDTGHEPSPCAEPSPHPLAPYLPLHGADAHHQGQEQGQGEGTAPHVRGAAQRLARLPLAPL